MAKKQRKVSERLQARQVAWDRAFKDKQGFKRPGSNKKSQPRGKRH